MTDTTLDPFAYTRPDLSPQIVRGRLIGTSSAFGGRPDDAELIHAGQRLEELHRRLRDQPDDDEADRIADEQGKVMVFVNNAEPAPLLGCIIKLRVLADPDVGMEAGDRPDDVDSVRQVLAFLEGMAGSGS
jgi:hypothetical protein